DGELGPGVGRFPGDEPFGDSDQTRIPGFRAQTPEYGISQDAALGSPLRGVPEMTSQAQTTVPDKASVHRAVLREASFDDYKSIADLHGRNGLMIRSGEDWRALWEANPAFQEHPGPIGWVLETARGEIVGSLGNIPALYEMNGRKLRAAVTCGWAVDPPYR